MHWLFGINYIATYFQLRLGGIPDCETWRVSCVHGEQLYTETNGTMVFRIPKAYSVPSVALRA